MAALYQGCARPPRLLPPSLSLSNLPSTIAQPLTIYYFHHCTAALQAMLALGERVVPSRLLQWLEQHAQLAQIALSSNLSILLTYMFSKSSIFTAGLKSLRLSAVAASQVRGGGQEERVKGC